MSWQAWIVTSINDTHSHGPHMTRMSIRWIKLKAAAQLAHDRAVHLVPTHSLLSQQREKGIQITSHELRNILVAEYNREAAENGLELLSDTARMIHELQSIPTIFYIAVFSTHDKQYKETGRYVQAKITNKDGAHAWISLTPNDVNALRSGEYAFSVLDWLFYPNADMVRFALPHHSCSAILRCLQRRCEISDRGIKRT
jgi:hypothetical protein